MFYRPPVYRSTRSVTIRVIFGIGIPLVLILAIILAVKYIETENRNREREIALNFIGDILEQADRDDIFTVDDAGQYEFIRLFYDISYNGEYDDFVKSSVEFCSRVNELLYIKYPELNEYPRLVGWQDEFLLCIAAADGKYYFNYDKEYHRVRTNVFLEDYDLFENMDRIDQLYIYTCDFTEEQRKQLESTGDGYSFEIHVSNEVVRNIR